MPWNYNGLWKLLIDKGMNKTRLREVTGMGTNTVNRMVNGEPISMDNLEKICKALDCNIHDIVKYEKDVL